MAFLKNITQTVIDAIKGISPEEDVSSLKPTKRVKRKPPAGYRPGKDPEFDYFNPPKMARAMKKGGKVKKNRRDGLAQRGLTKGTFR